MTITGGCRCGAYATASRQNPSRHVTAGVATANTSVRGRARSTSSFRVKPSKSMVRYRTMRTTRRAET
jgi:hypothetical protein